MSLNQIVMLILCIGMNALFYAIDPFLAGIFVLMWPVWYMFHYKELKH